MTKIFPVFALACGGLCVSLATLAVAQTAPGGQAARTTARIVSNLEANDNYNLSPDSLGNALVWTTTLGASFNSQTPIDTFFIDGQGSARVSDLPSIGTEFLLDDPRLALRYSRNVDDSSLFLNFAARRVDLDFFDPLSDLNPDGTFDDSRNGGTLQTLRADFGGSINQNGPVSFDYDGLLYSREYSDLVGFSDNRTDMQQGDVNASVSFELSPILRAVVGGGYYRQIVEDNPDTDRTRTTLDAGFDGNINQRQKVTFRLGYSEEVTDRRSVKETVSGTVGRLGFITTVPTGEVRASLGSRLDENGTRTDLSLGRLLLWRSGSLDANIGVSTSDQTGYRAIGDISYSYALPRGQIRATLRQNTTVDEEGNNILVTNGGLSYNHLVSNLSSIDLSLAGGLTRYEESTQADSERVIASAQYTRVLTRDWSSFVGYRHRFAADDTEGPAHSNSIFVGVRRDFTSIR